MGVIPILAMAKKCLYTGILPPSGPPAKLLSSHGIELVDAGTGSEPSEDKLISLLHDADASIVGGAVYSRRVIESSPKLKVIARTGVGFDRVDLIAASERQVHVTITPIPELAYTLAEHTFALILSQMRSIPYLNQSVREGNWTPQDSWRITDDLYYKTLGLLGLGRIGSEVAKRGRAFGMRTIYYDQIRRQDLESSHNIQFVSMDELLAESDVLSIHTPLNDQTRGLINDAAIRKMKRTAVLVNTARGPIVEEEALGSALRENRLAGASLDVLYQEPPLSTSPFFKLGDRLPRVVLTPHCAVSGHTIQLMGIAAAEEVARVLSGEKPRYPVNSIR